MAHVWFQFWFCYGQCGHSLLFVVPRYQTSTHRITCISSQLVNTAKINDSEALKSYSIIPLHFNHSALYYSKSYILHHHSHIVKTIINIYWTYSEAFLTGQMSLLHILIFKLLTQQPFVPELSSQIIHCIQAVLNIEYKATWSIYCQVTFHL